MKFRICVCDACEGEGYIEGYFGIIATPNGPEEDGYREPCLCCNGIGEIAVVPVEEDTD